jgi:hypothetical protein
MGMLYEKTQDGECYKTATLVVGNSMGPASILGKQASQTLPYGAPDMDRRRQVYFEQNRHGKWRPVLVPQGENAAGSVPPFRRAAECARPCICSQHFSAPPNPSKTEPLNPASRGCTQA